MVLHARPQARTWELGEAWPGVGPWTWANCCWEGGAMLAETCRAMAEEPRLAGGTPVPGEARVPL